MDDNRDLIAVASNDGYTVDCHFGRAKSFYIFELCGEDVDQIEVREVEPACLGGFHEEESLERNVRIISDCKYLLVSRIGYGASTLVERYGVEVYELPGEITDSIEQLIRFIKVKSLFQ